MAKAAASLDVLSNGRFLFGVGVGWLADEFEAAGMPFADRAARTREAIRLMRTLWSEDTPSFAGRFHQVAAARLQPQAGAAARTRRSSSAANRRRRCGARRRSATAGSASRIPPTASAPCWRPCASISPPPAAAPEGFEITVGTAPGVRLDRDTIRAFADAGVHRLFAFSPGFVPRGKLASDLYPAMERFAAEHIGA